MCASCIQHTANVHFISKQHICSLRNVYKDGFLAISWNDKAMTFLTTEWLDHTVACRPSTCPLGPKCNSQRHVSINHIWRRIAISLCWRWCSQVAGINSNYSFYKMIWTVDTLLFSKCCATSLITSGLFVAECLCALTFIQLPGQIHVGTWCCELAKLSKVVRFDFLLLHN